jgi:hypothetical protein
VHAVWADGGGGGRREAAAVRAIGRGFVLVFVCVRRGLLGGEDAMDSFAECDHHSCRAYICDVQPLHRCGGCRGPSYCSKSCQKAAWPAHKEACKELAAAAAAATKKKEEPAKKK